MLGLLFVRGWNYSHSLLASPFTSVVVIVRILCLLWTVRGGRVVNKGCGHPRTVSTRNLNNIIQMFRDEIALSSSYFRLSWVFMKEISTICRCPKAQHCFADYFILHQFIPSANFEPYFQLNIWNFYAHLVFANITQRSIQPISNSYIHFYLKRIYSMNEYHPYASRLRHCFKYNHKRYTVVYEDLEFIFVKGNSKQKCEHSLTEKSKTWMLRENTTLISVYLMKRIFNGKKNLFCPISGSEKNIRSIEVVNCIVQPCRVYLRSNLTLTAFIKSSERPFHEGISFSQIMMNV